MAEHTPQVFEGENSVLSTMGALSEVIKKIPYFRVFPDVKAQWNDATVVYENGDEAAAVRAGLKAIDSLRNIFGAFLRNAIIGKTIGEKREAGFFENLILKKEAEFYEDDIIAGLRKKLAEAEMAVNGETNGTFEKRIDAYLMIQSSLVVADAQQAQVDKKRVVHEANFAVKDGEDPTTAQKRVATLMAKRRAEEQKRQAAEAAKMRRKDVATTARAMFV